LEPAMASAGMADMLHYLNPALSKTGMPAWMENDYGHHDHHDHHDDHDDHRGHRGHRGQNRDGHVDYYDLDSMMALFGEESASMDLDHYDDYSYGSGSSMEHDNWGPDAFMDTSFLGMDFDSYDGHDWFDVEPLPPREEARMMCSDWNFEKWCASSWGQKRKCVQARNTVTAAVTSLLEASQKFDGASTEDEFDIAAALAGTPVRAVNATDGGVLFDGAGRGTEGVNVTEQTPLLWEDLVHSGFAFAVEKEGQENFVYSCFIELHSADQMWMGDFYGYSEDNNEEQEEEEEEAAVKVDKAREVLTPSRRTAVTQHEQTMERGETDNWDSFPAPWMPMPFSGSAQLLVTLTVPMHDQCS